MSPNWDGYDFDEDGNPEWVGFAQEEPNCPPCGDSGVTGPRGLLRRLLRRTNCVSCCPTQLDLRLYAIRWRIVSLARAVRPRRRMNAAFDDEAPF